MASTIRAEDFYTDTKKVALGDVPIPRIHDTYTTHATRPPKSTTVV
jgi:hypothetical protein